MNPAEDPNPQIPHEGIKKCTQCDHCVLEDTGYSNWTVMGTELHCLEDAHPVPAFDLWYGEDYRTYFAMQCPKFKPTERGPLMLDVERRDDYASDERYAKFQEIEIL